MLRGRPQVVIPGVHQLQFEQLLGILRVELGIENAVECDLICDGVDIPRRSDRMRSSEWTNQRSLRPCHVSIFDERPREYKKLGRWTLNHVKCPKKIISVLEGLVEFPASIITRSFVSCMHPALTQIPG